jgi:hypothetical protein
MTTRLRNKTRVSTDDDDDGECSESTRYDRDAEQVASRRGHNANRISSAYVTLRVVCSTDVDNEVILNTVCRPAYE